jgi:tRNA uridine 5-carboxymethylaminomethyl modification enzyme
LELKSSLEYRHIRNLFCAGQFNGSSGYEEAAAQGLMAGINAVLAINGKEPFVLDRSEAYIGVLIDDLTTKGTNEPYRIMTSRAEYRLVLRQDNADLRLTEKGKSLGLVTEERYTRYCNKKESVELEIERLEGTYILAKQAGSLLEERGSSPIKERASLADLLRRPEISYESLLPLDPERPALSRHAREQIEVQIKYEGYIVKQMQQIQRFRKMEEKKLPQNMDYKLIEGLRIEAVQKLNQLQPSSLGQASRISGVSPADINVLLIHLEKERRKGGGKDHGKS